MGSVSFRPPWSDSCRILIRVAKIFIHKFNQNGDIYFWFLTIKQCDIKLKPDPLFTQSKRIRWTGSVHKWNGSETLQNNIKTWLGEHWPTNYFQAQFDFLDEIFAAAQEKVGAKPDFLLPKVNSFMNLQDIDIGFLKFIDRSYFSVLARSLILKNWGA